MDLQPTGQGQPERQPAGEMQATDGPVPLLVHIGLHKTGSTWLQQHLFADAERGFDQPDEPRHAIIGRLAFPDPLAFDAKGAADHYAPAIADARRSRRTLVLSHERLSGYPSAGGRDRVLIAERLRAAFPEARILLVFREQRSLIRSMYSQHVTDGGVESFERFIETPEPRLGRKPSFMLELYEFDRLITLYHGLFGEDRVLALPVEMLAREPQRFADHIARFCGLPFNPVGPIERSNEKRPLLMQQVQRPLNMLFYHNELSPGALVHIQRFHKRYARLRPLFERLSPSVLERRLEQRLRAAVERHVGQHYATSNRRTAELTGIALGTFGYPVG